MLCSGSEYGVTEEFSASLCHGEHERPLVLPAFVEGLIDLLGDEWGCLESVTEGSSG